jgi:iduronate 2-sulfatase
MLLGCLALTAAAASAAVADDAKPRWNVLMIAVDDMRPQLGCYGDPTVKSPEIDRLASRGLVFDRVYCQQALCSPSRTSLLSGRYPPSTKVYTIDESQTVRTADPNIVTLPQHFKNQGYFTRSLGKVYHVGIDDPASWSVPPWHSKKPRYGPEGQKAVKARREALLASGKPIPKKGQGGPGYAGPAFEAPAVADDDLLDGDTAREAVGVLRELAKKPEQPFFLAVGFANPHVPWVAPRPYFDLYDPAALPLAANPFPPREAPGFAAKSGDDFYWYGNVPKDRKLSELFERECLQGYLAAISYIDAQVGRVLRELEATGLAKNTVVVLWGDHGYYMGEHGWWGGKHNNYEGATRVALIVATPDARAAGAHTKALAEFVDIAPTLADLCGLPPVSTFEGRSLTPLLADPKGSVQDAAFSWYPKGGNLGTAMRTDRYRYVEWIDRQGEVAARELYDHDTDPQENQNLATDPAQASRMADLSRLMHARVQVPRP